MWEETLGCPIIGLFMHRPVLRRILIGLILLTGLTQTGCRVMSRFGESRQSIAARRLSRLGMQAMHEGQWATAESLFGEALQVSTGDDRAHAGLAESLWNRGERAEAVRHMEEASRLSAGDPKYLLRLGRMYLDLGRLADAERQSLAALQVERETAESWSLRGDCLLAAERHAEALAAYHRALAIQPDAEHAQLQAAEIYYLQGRYDRLLASLDCAREYHGAEQLSPRADVLRGVAFRRLGRPGEAKRAFARAAERLPGDATPHLHLASLAIGDGDEAAARASLAAALAADPSALSRADGADATTIGPEAAALRLLDSGAVPVGGNPVVVGQERDRSDGPPPLLR